MTPAEIAGALFRGYPRMMRQQGIAANATPRIIRGNTKGKTKDALYRAQQRHGSTSVRERVTDVVNELRSTGTIRDPAKSRLLDTRKAVIANWSTTADLLDAQGERTLASEVRYFARHLPPVLTDKEMVATLFLQHRSADSSTEPAPEMKIRDHELTR
jgi:hypothetical protein